jgi:hypothetical protein
MGFLDKAKQLAEQAQTKLDDAQKQFNESQSGRDTSQPAVEYDDHGRPVQREAPPEPATTRAPVPAAPAPPVGDAPSEPEDRNHPSYEPPPLTSGDPLAG